MTKFAHTVDVVLPEKLVRIWRVFEDGRKQLFTEVHFPDDLSRDQERMLLQQLAENIFLDTPSGRSLLAS